MIKSIVIYAQSIRVDYDPEQGLSYIYSDAVNSPLPLTLYLDRELLLARELHNQLGLFLDAVDKGAEWHKPLSNLQ